MTDADKEIIFKSIAKFDDFIESVNNKRDITLNDSIKIQFNIDNKNLVNISINSRNHNLDFINFLDFINELKQEKIICEREEIQNQTNLFENRKRNEIFELDNNNYKVHKEYIGNMYNAKDIASVHELYLKKLADLKIILRKKGVLKIDDKDITTEIELIEHLKSIGFENVEIDFNRRIF